MLNDLSREMPGTQYPALSTQTSCLLIRLISSKSSKVNDGNTAPLTRSTILSPASLKGIAQMLTLLALTANSKPVTSALRSMMAARKSST